MYARTIVIELAKQERKESKSPPVGEGDGVGRVACRTLTCDGAPFDWWVVGEDPALVTVRSALLGRLNGFTDSDPEPFAMSLAKQLVDRAEAERSASADSAPQSPLEKPGWFEK